MIGKKCGPSEATLKVKDLQRLTVKHFVNVVWTSAWKSNQCTKAIFIPDSFPVVLQGFVLCRVSCLAGHVRAIRSFPSTIARVSPERQETNQLLFSLLTKIQTHIYLGNTTFKPTCWFLFVTLRHGPLRKGGVGGGEVTQFFRARIFFSVRSCKNVFFLFGSFNIIILFTFSRAIISFLVITQNHEWFIP